MNDVAVAIAVVRKEGFARDVSVLGLDAHPPDCVARCLGGTVWIGSISGAERTAPEGVDEVLLAPNTGENVYLSAMK